MKNRLLIVTSEFPPLPGGIGNHALNLANSLTNKKYKVSVLTDCRDAGNKDLIFDKSLSFMFNARKLESGIMSLVIHITLGSIAKRRTI